MKKNKELVWWTFLHTLVIPISYLLGMIVLLQVHGLFGYNMTDEGSYLSNALMHIGSGAVLAFGTGLLQKALLERNHPVPWSWVWFLAAGFVAAELIAGLILWKLEIYRGLINLFNTDQHYPEAMIFCLAGLIAGTLQYRYFPDVRKRLCWIAASALGWGSCILLTYLSIYAFIGGAFLYAILTGFVIRNHSTEKHDHRNTR